MVKSKRPAMVTGTTPVTVKKTIKGLTADTYVCSLTVTDNKKTFNTASVNATMNPVINKLSVGHPHNAAMIAMNYPQISAAALNVLQCAFTISLISVEYPPPIATAQGIPCCFKA